MSRAEGTDPCSIRDHGPDWVQATDCGAPSGALPERPPAVDAEGLEWIPYAAAARRTGRSLNTLARLMRSGRLRRRCFPDGSWRVCAADLAPYVPPEEGPWTSMVEALRILGTGSHATLDAMVRRGAVRVFAPPDCYPLYHRDDLERLARVPRHAGGRPPLWSYPSLPQESPIPKAEAP